MVKFKIIKKRPADPLTPPTKKAGGPSSKPAKRASYGQSQKLESRPPLEEPQVDSSTTTTPTRQKLVDPTQDGPAARAGKRQRKSREFYGDWAFQSAQEQASKQSKATTSIKKSASTVQNQADKGGGVSNTDSNVSTTSRGHHIGAGESVIVLNPNRPQRVSNSASVASTRTPSRAHSHAVDNAGSGASTNTLGRVQSQGVTNTDTGASSRTLGRVSTSTTLSGAVSYGSAHQEYLHQPLAGSPSTSVPPTQRVDPFISYYFREKPNTFLDHSSLGLSRQRSPQVAREHSEGVFKFEPGEYDHIFEETERRFHQNWNVKSYSLEHVEAYERPPPGQPIKRVKNKRITRPFVIGSESWELTPELRTPTTPPDHTKGWRVYVAPASPAQPALTTWLRKVQFKIFQTYTNPVRVVEEPPFEIRETGWGGFIVDIKLFFCPEASAKPESRSHFLQLEPYGDEKMQETQRKEKRVKAETMESIEFNEPTEALWDILTSEDQFMDPKKRGKGKGKGRASIGEDGSGPGQGTVELPARGEVSKETEKMNLEQLHKAMEVVGQQKKVTEDKARETLGKLDELRKIKEEGKDSTGGGAAAARANGEANPATQSVGEAQNTNDDAGEGAMEGVETTA